MFYFAVPLIISIVFTLTAAALAFFAERDLLLASSALLTLCFMALYRYLSCGRARKNLAKLENLKKSIKNSVKIGETIVVLSGERIPADGIVLEGEAVVNEFPLTGSPQQILRRKDDPVYATTINEDGDLKILIRLIDGDTMISRVIGAVREAKNFTTGFQKKAALAGIIIGLSVIFMSVGAYFWRVEGINIAIAMLLIFSLEFGSFSIGKLWEARVSRLALHGIVVKRNETAEKISSVFRVALDMDKYFSRSKKDFSYMRSFWGALDNDILALVASAERYSDHPLADAILAEAHRKGVKYKNPDSFSVIKGEGVVATLDGARVTVGSENLINTNNIHIQDEIRKHIDTEKQQGVEMALVARDNKIIGAFSFSDAKKKELQMALSQLESLGVKEAGKEDRGGPALVMGGDSDKFENSSGNIHLSVDALGAGVFSEKADILLMSDSFGLLQKLIIVSRETLSASKRILVLLLGFNAVGILLIWEGVLGPYGAVLFHILAESFIFIYASRESKKDGAL